MCSNCGPSKYSPEFFKPQKPENHAGCGCGPKSNTTATIKKKVKRGCFVRYSVVR